MLTQLLLLSLLSALVTLSVARHGLGVLTRDPGRARNRAYFGLCLALALWSFAATMLPSAPDDRVWLWFRISLAGRTLAPCLLLHLALLVTARPSAPARRRLHAALYLPGIWFFAAGARAPESIGVAGFERSDWGWATVSGGLSAASGAYLVFFAGFVCAALAVVFRWGRRVELLSKRAQARRVVWTGLSTLALVLASGFALPWLGIRAAPEIPHVFAIVWVLALRRLAAGDDSLLASPSAVAEDILRTIADAVLLLDRGRRVVKVNQAGERLLGVEEAAAAGAQLSAVVGAEPAAAILELVEAGERRPLELGIAGGRGRPTPIQVTHSVIRDEHGQDVGTVVILRDVTEQKRIEEQLRFTATHDPLTGLPNRSLLADRLEQAAARAVRRGRSFAVLICDLDRFKDINDTYGHAAGDAVLRSVARVLLHSVRGADTVCRMAGDEFLLAVEDLQQPTDVEIVVNRILRSFENPVLVDGHSILASACIGISLFPGDGDAGETLVQKADLALYSAKSQGRGLFRYFSPEMEEANRRRVAVERGLRTALRDGELYLLYQPMVDLGLSEISGVEALLRWRSRDLGLMQPADFIPIAERTGLIVPIGEWVLRTACRQSRAWQLAGERPVPVSVNVSARQLQEEDFVERVGEILLDTGLEPALLELELTETAALQNLDESEQLVNRLAELGVRIVIDDFGTGHSSLSRLRHLPMHAVKIDRAFVRNITSRPKDRDLVTAILAMARKLKVGIIAEGVETVAQLELLQSLEGRDGDGGDLRRFQGFLFSRPVDAETIPELFRRTRERGALGGDRTATGPRPLSARGSS